MLKLSWLDSFVCPHKACLEELQQIPQALQIAREHHPTSKATEMEHLITPDQEDWKIGGLVAFFEKFDPPTDWDPGINQHVEHAQGQACRPA